MTDPEPMTYSKITVAGNKVQVDSAIRDEDGLRIKTKYALKSENDLKLDKVDTADTFGRVYSVAQNGTQQMIRYTGATLQYSLAYRNIRGTLNVATPEEDDHAANKKYVDDGLATKQATLVGSGTGQNIKTINSTSLLGTGDISIPVITVDNALSGTSTNPVQNKLVKAALDTKQDTLIAGQDYVQPVSLGNGDVTKIGTADVGTNTKPVKIVGGVPTAVANDFVDIPNAQTITGLKTMEATSTAKDTISLTIKGDNMDVSENTGNGYYTNAIQFVDKDGDNVAKFSTINSNDGYYGFLAGTGTDPTNPQNNLLMLCARSNNQKLLLIPPTTGHSSGAVRHDYLMGKVRTSFQSTPTDTVWPSEKLVKDSLDGKVDKVTTSGQNRAYGVSTTGEQTMLNVIESAAQGSIPWRTLGGRLLVGTPTGDSDATTKKYVDDAVGAIPRQVFRGTFNTWSDVLAVDTGYLADDNSSKTPKDGDFIVVYDVSDFTDDSLTVVTSDITGANASLSFSYSGETITVHYSSVTGQANTKTIFNKVSVYYDSPSSKWKVYALVACTVESTNYAVNDLIFEWGYSSQHQGVITYSAGSYIGEYVFQYDGTWSIDGTAGWKMIYSTTLGVQSTLDNKVDKQTHPGQGVYLYGNTTGQVQIPCQTEPNAQTVAYRGTGGTLRVGTPTSDDHATTKKYVDDRVVTNTGDYIVITPKLPSGYTKLASITSSGTQYINTGVAVDNNNSFELDFESVTGNNEGYIISQGNNSIRQSGTTMTWYTGAKHFQFQVAYSNRFLVRCGYNYISVNGNFVTGTHDSDAASGTHVYLLAKNDGNAKALATVFRFRIYDSTDALVFDGIPAKRNSDNAIGLYDIISDSFKANAGTGAFTAGAEVTDANTIDAINVLPRSGGILDGNLQVNGDIIIQNGKNLKFGTSGDGITELASPQYIITFGNYTSGGLYWARCSNMPISTAAQTALNGKLDKVTTTSVGYRAYIINPDGTQGTLDIRQSAVASTIAWRDTGGVLLVGTPTADNHATTKAYVDSAISTATANFLGTYDEVSDLGLTTSATNAQIATALGSYASFPSTPTKNDYVIVTVNVSTTTDVDEYRRFKYDGSAWNYEYTINNTAFSTTQWAAINSGANTTNIGAIANKLDKVTPSSPGTYVYASNSDGIQLQMRATDSAVNGSIPYRSYSNGTIKIGAPVDDADAATKKYVDDSLSTELSGYLPLSGGTLTGSLTLTGTNGITSNNIIFNDWKLNVARVASGKLYRYIGIDTDSNTGWLKTRSESDVKNDLGINNKLDKLTYEWNKDLDVATGTAGYVLLFDGYTYDSGVVIDIDCTTAGTYHGTLVIATQNSVPKLAKVYGDADNTITPALYIVPPTGMTSEATRRMKVYLVPQSWSKNFVRVRAKGLYSTSTAVSTCPMTFTEGSVPSDATWRPTNALDSKLDKVTLGANVSHQAYVALAGGTQSMIDIVNGASAWTLCWRNGEGCISVGTPTDNTHAATKKYVDDAISGFSTDDKNVRQTADSTTSTAKPILISTVSTSGTDAGANYCANVTITASTGTITATKFSGPLTGNVTGNCSGSSGSCTGNSATATTLASSSTSTIATTAGVQFYTGSILSSAASEVWCIETYRNGTNIMQRATSISDPSNVAVRTSGNSGTTWAGWVYSYAVWKA